MQGDGEQPRVGFWIAAEGDDARDALLLRARLQPPELRIVAVEPRGAAGLDAGKDLGLGIGDRLDAGEELQMHRLYRGDDGDMRPHHLHQRLPLAARVFSLYVT